MVNMISSLSGKSYEEKLAEINTMSLASRRIRADLIQTFKITKGVCTAMYLMIFSYNSRSR